jgi:hypothetical protein
MRFWCLDTVKSGIQHSSCLCFGLPLASGQQAIFGTWPWLERFHLPDSYFGARAMPRITCLLYASAARTGVTRFTAVTGLLP